MQIIENDKIHEKMYIEKLENGLTIIIFPKKGHIKKYISWGVNFGSIDNCFIRDGKKVELPDGVAHYLEHKMFEQKDKPNSLDKLSELGVEANAFTTNTYTNYLFECTDHFYEALDEFMDYIQHPYYTHENVEKERGIIEQEIAMYDDEPGWNIFLNAMKLMYHKNPIRIDIAGTKESISKIDENMLYDIYNSFYVPENMAIVVVGDFEINIILEEIKSRVIMKHGTHQITRVYEEEPDSICEKNNEKNMDISIPMLNLCYKDVPDEKIGNARKYLAMEILSELILGEASTLHKKLYEEGLIVAPLSMNYEFGRTYAFTTIQGLTKDPKIVSDAIRIEISKMKKTGIKQEDFDIQKKKLYGEYVKEYNDVSNKAHNLVSDYFQGINSFEYFDEFETLTKEYVEEVLKTTLIDEKSVISIINTKEN